MLMPIMVFAKNYDKEFIKHINKHDVPEAVRTLPRGGDAALFWNTLLNNSPIIDNFLKDISKQKGAEKDAMAAVGRMSGYDYRYDVEILRPWEEICDTLLMDMGMDNGICDLHVIDDPTVNAFCVLWRNGFDICLNSGLLESMEYDRGRVMAIIAHEIAHGAMLHFHRTEYEAAKKQRKDKVMAGIAAGLNTVAAGIDAYTSATVGTPYDPSDYARSLEGIKDDLKKSSRKFRYKYTREVELEADLVAYRFMDYLGLGHKYLEALDVLKRDNSYWWVDSTDSDHPAIDYRISFIEFVANNPEHGLTIKSKNKK